MQDFLRYLIVVLDGNIDKDRNNHRRCSAKKSVLKNFAKFTGKHLCQSLFFNKVAEHLFTEHLWTTAFVKKVNNLQITKAQPHDVAQLLLTFFCQFQPVVAYKNVAYEKSMYMKYPLRSVNLSVSEIYFVKHCL